MGTTSRKRTSHYLGPKEMVSRDRLAVLDKSGEWVFEVKYDGFWCLLVCDDGVITRAESRVGVALDAPGIVGTKLPGGGSGMLVGELTADIIGTKRSGERRIHLFDVLEWNGIDLRGLTLVQRRQALEMIHASAIGSNQKISLTETKPSNIDITTWYDEIISKMGEGVVGKKKDSIYRVAKADGKTEAWIRCKPLRTVDYVVLGQGTAEGGTPNLQLGLWRNVSGKQKLVKVMDVTLPSFLQKTNIIGKVVELEGYEIWNSGAIRSGQVRRVREDKAAEDCTYEAAMRWDANDRL